MSRVSSIIFIFMALYFMYLRLLSIAVVLASNMLFVSAVTGISFLYDHMKFFDFCKVVEHE